MLLCEQMAETARLGELQRDTIIRLRDLYLRNVGILARRRKQLTAALQVGVGPYTLYVDLHVNGCKTDAAGVGMG